MIAPVDDSPFEADAEVRRRRSSLLVLQAVLTLVLVGLSLGDTSGLHDALGLMILRALWAPLNVGIVFGVVRRLYPARRRTRVRADSDGLWFDRVLQVPGRSVKTAFAIPSKPPRVRIVRSFRSSVDVVVADSAEANALLRALHFGASAATASFEASWSEWKVLVYAVLVPAIACTLAVAPSSHFHLLTLIYAMPLLVFALSMAVRGRIDVGTDGLLFARLGVTEFLSYGNLESAAAVGERKIVLHRKDGRRISATIYDPERGQLRDALLERINEARDTRALDSGTRDLGVLFAPAARSPRDWVRFVRNLTQAGGYREAAWGPERLWRIVEDPDKDPAVRAGAAAALGPGLDASGRERLRVAAHVSASPPLRVALEAAAGGEDASLEEALEPLARRARIE
jgi:hypothetical protein